MVHALRNVNTGSHELVGHLARVRGTRSGHDFVIQNEFSRPFGLLRAENCLVPLITSPFDAFLSFKLLELVHQNGCFSFDGCPTTFRSTVFFGDHNRLWFYIPNFPVFFEHLLTCSGTEIATLRQTKFILHGSGLMTFMSFVRSAHGHNKIRFVVH